MKYTVREAKTKALINFAVTASLVCALVLAYAKCWFSYDMAHSYLVDLFDLTPISLASFLWDIGKQYSPRCDAADCGVPSGAILFAKRIFIKKII